MLGRGNMGRYLKALCQRLKDRPVKTVNLTAQVCKRCVFVYIHPTAFTLTGLTITTAGNTGCNACIYADKCRSRKFT